MMSSEKDNQSSDYGSNRSSASNYFAKDDINLDGCPWEVESTKEFWKSFAKLDYPIKVNASRKISQLARGEWRFKAHKTIRTQNLHLYAMTLTAKQKVIWQLAVTYSATQTERYRKENKSTKAVVYSQIIRLWSIVDGSSKKLADCIKIIKSAVNRGQALDNTIVQKKLKVLSSGYMDNMHETSPALFYSIEVGSVTDDCITIDPPAENEYTPLHLIKIDNSVLHAILSSTYDREQLVFKVSPEEHEIINIDSSEHIILLGRSGTGKTTCCLYRMWNQFFDYWKDRNPCTAADEGFQSGACDLSSCSEEPSSSQKPMCLQQVFITKSKILCSRFKNAFYDLLHGKRELDIHGHCQYETVTGPKRMQHFHPYAFPLFLTSHRWLLLLDVSLEGTKFFEYGWDGSLITDILQLENIEGSSEDIVLLNAEEKDETSDQEMTKQWRKVDSEYFASFIWPRLCKTKSKEQIKGIDPILVWMEIYSFIKGSFLALKSKAGFLSETEYYQLGKKMAPNFKTNREIVYACFEEYEKEKKRKRYFDDNDLVHNLYHRLLETQGNKAIIHQLYIDEVQDFTQAELALFLHCCHLPCGLFLTGDTAQSIMRSVSFRFCDLQSIFHEFWDHFSLEKEIKIPQLYTLTQNFRSHSGILQLASSVIDLLTKFFRSSLDKLPADQGMFPGPKPVLLLSCDFNMLALMLSRKASAIEFGAKQAIIVQSEEAKHTLPDQLKGGIVLTVYEAKGLEFDDVLLYNFFSNSKAGDKWRVVTNYTRQYMTEHPEIDKPLKHIISEPRCLDFDEKLHKSLNSDLKFLYTAITRAKCKLWIYDSDKNKRAPIFHYFIERGLVEPLSIDSGEDVSQMPQFVVKSSKAEWKRQGNHFKDKGIWKLASICFNNAESPLLYHDSIGHMHVQLGEKQHNARQHYFSAVNSFCECLKLQQSAKYVKKIASCLYNLQLYYKAATLFENVQEDDRAIKIYHQIRTTKSLQNAVRLQEQKNNFEGAIATCLMDANDSLLTKALQISLKLTSAPSNVNHTVSRLALKTAKHYVKLDKPGHARDTAQLIKLEERLHFYKQENWIDEVVELLQSNRRLPELYRYLKGNGRFEDGANIASKFEDIDSHVCFVLMGIKEKLLDPGSYTEETKSQDIKILSYLTNFQDVNCILAILRCDARECFKLHERLEGYSRAEMFNMYAIAHSDNPERVNVQTVLKNLRHLLHIYRTNCPSKDMIKHFHVEIQNKNEYWVPPLVLHILDPKSEYKKDLDGMFMLTEAQLKSLFARNIKSIAKNWLEILQNFFGEQNESCVAFSDQKLFWKFLAQYPLHIEYKYYCEQFGVAFEIASDGTTAPCSAAQMLLKMFNFEWICYIPLGHPEVQSFVQDITNSRMVISKVFKQTKLSCTNIQGFLEQWVFQGSTTSLHKYASFTEFAIDTIQMYLKFNLSESDRPDIDRIVSELEVVTIGLLAIVSQLEDHVIVLPQSYQIVFDLFNKMNTCNLLHILTNENGTETVWEILPSLIMILLGEKHDSSDGLLAKSLKFKTKDLKKSLFGFERYFVLTVAVYGNLAPFLHRDTKALFQETFRTLTASSSDSSNKNNLLLLKKLPIFSETTELFELFEVINEIQAKYSRRMVTYDFTSLNFKLVQPSEIPQTKNLIDYTEKCKISIKRDVTKDPEKNLQGAEPNLLSMQEKDFPPLTKQGGKKDACSQNPEASQKQETGLKVTQKDTLAQKQDGSSQKHETSLQEQEVPLQRQNNTNLPVQEETQESYSDSQQSKRETMHIRSSDKALCTERSPPDDLVALNQTETAANFRAQESLMKQDTKEKSKEKLIARSKEFRFQPGYKLSTEQKRCLDPSQEKIKAIKAQWGRKDI